MSRSSSSDDEIRGQKGENSPNLQIIKPINVSIVGTSHSPKGSSAMNNNNSKVWPPYCLPPGYAPPIATQGLTSPLYSMVQNSLYQNAYVSTIMANMPMLGSQTLHYGILPTPPNVNPTRNIEISIPSSSGPPNTTRIENARPIFPNMPQTLP